MTQSASITSVLQRLPLRAREASGADRVAPPSKSLLPSLSQQGGLSVPPSSGVHMHACVRMCAAAGVEVWMLSFRLEDNSQGLILYSNHLGPRNETQVIRLGKGAFTC